MKHINEHFRRHDPILWEYIERIGLSIEKPPYDLFERLVASIISQQLSGKAAASIFARLKKLFNGNITSKALLTVEVQKIRDCGLSWAKVASLRDLAQKVKERKVHLDKLRTMTDEDVIAELTQVKGIGPWTAEMFLMFALGREDVFSHGDLGLRKAIQKIYGFKDPPTRAQIEKIIKKWSPYKSHASRILWKSLELQAT